MKQSHQRRLAGTIRPDHAPVLAVAHDPVEVLEDAPARSMYRNVVEHDERLAGPRARITPGARTADHIARRTLDCGAARGSQRSRREQPSVLQPGDVRERERSVRRAMRAEYPGRTGTPEAPELDEHGIARTSIETIQDLV